MNFPDGYLPPAWITVGWIVLGLLAARLWRQLRAAPPALDANLWLASCALLAALWLMHARLDAGLTLHFLGAAALYLMFGAPLAIIGMAIVAALAAALGLGGWQALPWEVLLDGVLPVAVAHGLRRAAERWLPPNPFVYFIGIAFLGAGASVVAVAFASTALHAAAGHYALRDLVHGYLPYALLLGFGEAFLSGMLITVFVVYRRTWVSTFDDARWLRGP